MKRFLQQVHEIVFLFFKWYAISVDFKILFNKFIRFNQLLSMMFNCFSLLFYWSSIVFVYFFKAFLEEEQVNLACSITLLYFFPIRYSYLSIFPDDNADIFAASPLILYFGFLCLILSIVMTSFYILSKRFFLKHKRLSDKSVTSINKKEYGFAGYFL